MPSHVEVRLAHVLLHAQPLCRLDAALPPLPRRVPLAAQPFVRTLLAVGTASMTRIELDLGHACLAGLSRLLQEGGTLGRRGLISGQKVSFGQVAHNWRA